MPWLINVWPALSCSSLAATQREGRGWGAERTAELYESLFTAGRLGSQGKGFQLRERRAQVWTSQRDWPVLQLVNLLKDRVNVEMMWPWECSSASDFHHHHNLLASWRLQYNSVLLCGGGTGGKKEISSCFDFSCFLPFYCDKLAFSKRYKRYNLL